MDMPALQFLSTPSGWRATVFPPNWFTPSGISIHALRVEGDQLYGGAQIVAADRISIHALRVEGDLISFADRLGKIDISIHALRVEGDDKDTK